MQYISECVLQDLMRLETDLQLKRTAVFCGMAPRFHIACSIWQWADPENACSCPHVSCIDSCIWSPATSFLRTLVRAQAWDKTRGATAWRYVASAGIRQQTTGSCLCPNLTFNQNWGLWKSIWILLSLFVLRSQSNSSIHLQCWALCRDLENIHKY